MATSLRTNCWTPVTGGSIGPSSATVQSQLSAAQGKRCWVALRVRDQQLHATFKSTGMANFQAAAGGSHRSAARFFSTAARAFKRPDPQNPRIRPTFAPVRKHTPGETCQPLRIPIENNSPEVKPKDNSPVDPFKAGELLGVNDRRENYSQEELRSRNAQPANGESQQGGEIPGNGRPPVADVLARMRTVLNKTKGKGVEAAGSRRVHLSSQGSREQESFQENLLPQFAASRQAHSNVLAAEAIGETLPEDSPPRFVESQDRLVESQNRLVDMQNRLVDMQNRPVDLQNRPVEDRQPPVVAEPHDRPSNGQSSASLLKGGLPRFPTVKNVSVTSRLGTDASVPISGGGPETRRKLPPLKPRSRFLVRKGSEQAESGTSLVGRADSHQEHQRGNGASGETAASDSGNTLRLSGYRKRGLEDLEERGLRESERRGLEELGTGGLRESERRGLEELETGGLRESERRRGLEESGRGGLRESERRGLEVSGTGGLRESEKRGLEEAGTGGLGDAERRGLGSFARAQSWGHHLFEWQRKERHVEAGGPLTEWLRPAAPAEPLMKPDASLQPLDVPELATTTRGGEELGLGERLSLGGAAPKAVPLTEWAVTVPEKELETRTRGNSAVKDEEEGNRVTVREESPNEAKAADVARQETEAVPLTEWLTQARSGGPSPRLEEVLVSRPGAKLTEWQEQAEVSAASTSVRNHRPDVSNRPPKPVVSAKPSFRSRPIVGNGRELSPGVSDPSSSNESERAQAAARNDRSVSDASDGSTASVEDMQRSPEWHALRRWRLTASAFGNAAGCWPDGRLRLWEEKLELRPPFRGNAATAWGTKRESPAIDEYFRITGNSVAHQSFQIYKEHDEVYTWLGASPDGLIARDSAGLAQGSGVLEVKCPFGRGRPETAQPYGSVPFYYIPQVQGLLEIFNREWADVYVWTVNGSVVYRVERDPAYWALLFSVLSQFWWQHVIPAKHEMLQGRMDPAFLRKFEPQPTDVRTELIVEESKRLSAKSPAIWTDSGRVLHGRF